MDVRVAPAGRDADFCALNVDFTIAVVKAVLVLNRFPDMMKSSVRRTLLRHSSRCKESYHFARLLLSCFYDVYTTYAGWRVACLPASPAHAHALSATLPPSLKSVVRSSSPWAIHGMINRSVLFQTRCIQLRLYEQYLTVCNRTTCSCG